jgi:hypothetical protein
VDEWQRARLIPTWGVSSDTEAEMRATSATLSVLSVVRDFSSSLLSPLGAPTAVKASVECFTEPRFKKADGGQIRPDGAIVVSYGKRTWTALVEVKTGRSVLDPEQVNGYIEVARSNGYDAIITISNELAVAGQHPTKGLKLRSNSKVQVHHISWTRLLAIAVTCKVHRGVSDPEQSWILGELIRYLECDASGAMSFNDMGATWVAVREAARDASLRKNSDGAMEVVERWDQLVRFVSLKLGADIGADVQQVLTKPQLDPKFRTNSHLESLCSAGTLLGVLRVPNTVGDITLEADLRARRIAVSVQLSAPADRGNKGKLTWLLKQFKPDTPDGLIIEVWPRNAREPISVTLGQLRESKHDVEGLANREVIRFRLVQRSEMGLARKAGSKPLGFIDSVINAVEGFYERIVQNLVPYVAKAPQVRVRAPEIDGAAVVAFAPTPIHSGIAAADDDVHSADQSPAHAANSSTDEPPTFSTVNP